MNWSIFKDSKLTLGFSAAILLHVLGVIFAVENYGTWVVFVIAGIVIMFFSIQRAGYVYRSSVE
ncbi:damage-inducible protein DinB [Bacillus pfraonensis]|uniref:damage-inducible protein DinB n=1 Tax=Bacillus TaxID=1386 RepID=UPI002A581133|nr:damage-inducible protein DinB [Bacillus pseudomycoides]